MPEHSPIVWRVREPGWHELEWRSLYLIHHADGDANDERVERFTRNLERFSDSREKVTLAVVTGLRVRPPSPAGRARIVESMRARKDVIQETAIWIPAAGLVGAAIRSVATGIFLIGAPWLNSKVVANRRDFVSWVAKVNGASITEAESMMERLENENSSSTT